MKQLKFYSFIIEDTKVFYGLNNTISLYTPKNYHTRDIG